MNKSIVPQPLQTEVTIHLPPEALQIMKDIHADREGIGIGGIVLVICVVLRTIKRLCTK